MSALRDLFRERFPEEWILNGLKLKKGKRVFSLRINPEYEDAVGFDIDKMNVFGPGEPCCDGLFYCCDKREGFSIAVLVELKGVDVAHSLKQILSTSQKVHNHVIRCHGLAWEEGKRALLPHGPGAIGLVVSRQGFSFDPAERKKEWKQSRVLLLPPITGTFQGVTIHELKKMASFPG